jgi:hypothetical protein
MADRDDAPNPLARSHFPARPELSSEKRNINC